MSSMSRAIERNMMRYKYRTNNDKLLCSVCAKEGKRIYLKPSTSNSRKLHCPVCGWKGRLK